MQDPTIEQNLTLKQILALIILLCIVTFMGAAFTTGLLAALL